MESLGWRAYKMLFFGGLGGGGHPGAKSLRWRAWNGEPGIESLKNDEILRLDILEWRAWGGGPWVESLGFFLSGYGKVQISILSYLFNFYFIFLASFTKYHM